MSDHLQPPALYHLPPPQIKRQASLTWMLWRTEKSLSLLLGIEPRFLACPTRTLVTTPNAMSRLQQSLVLTADEVSAVEAHSV